jgi:hypothetical protein
MNTYDLAQKMKPIQCKQKQHMIIIITIIITITIITIIRTTHTKTLNNTSHIYPWPPWPYQSPCQSPTPGAAAQIGLDEGLVAVARHQGAFSHHRGSQEDALHLRR